MALTVPNQWTKLGGDSDAEVLAYPTPGNWLIAVIVCRTLDGSTPLLSLGDVSRNLWTLISDNTRFATSLHTGAALQAEVWACPAARYDGWDALMAYTSAMQITAPDTGALGVVVFEVAGMGNSTLTVDSVTLGTASAANSITLTPPAPTGGANCLFVAVAAGDIAYGSYSTTGTGWTQLNNLSTGPTPELGLYGAWREGTTATGCTFSLAGGFFRNWAGVVVALRATGIAPAQPNPAWPATSLQIGLGYDLATPLSRVRWTDQTTRYRELAGDRGIQAELGTAQQGSTTLVLRNDDGAYTPRPVGTTTATANGTATTIKVATSAATNINVSDFFRLQASGALKELNVFQVVSRSDAAGTTTVTFARADGTAGGAQAATATGDVYAGIQIDAYMPYRLCKTIGTGTSSKTHIVSSGWIRDLQISFADAHQSELQAECADALETLATANPSALRGEILRRSPTHYWPMNDSSGAGYATNASGRSTAALAQTVSKYGAGASTQAGFGASTQDITVIPGVQTTSLLGDPGTGWYQSGQTSAEITQKGYALVAAGVGDFPSITNGVTVFGVYLPNDENTDGIITAASVDPTLVILRNADPAQSTGQGSVIKLAVDNSTLNGVVTVWDKDTHAASSTTASGNQLGVNCQSFALVFDRTSWTLYVNGFSVGSGACDLVASFSGIDIGGEADAFFHGHSLPGVFAHFAIFGRKLTSTEVSRLNDLATLGKVGSESLTFRVRRKLNAVGWKGTRILTASGQAAAQEDAPSGSIADLGSEIASYESSLAFVDAASQYQYRSRLSGYQQTPRATLGDGPGEIPYQPGPAYGYNPVLLYNDVEVINTNTSGFRQVSTTTVVAVDDASVAKYGDRTLSVNTRLAETERAFHHVWWLLGQYAYPQLRVGTVTVSAAATSDAARWAVVCGVEVGDLLTITRRPIGQPAISLRCRVLRVQPHFSGRGSEVTAEVTLTLAAAPPIVPVLNNGSTLAGTSMGA